LNGRKRRGPRPAPRRCCGLGRRRLTRIARGTRVVEYVGERISKSESLRRCEANNEYIFTLNDEQDLDGNVARNPARLLNHSCAPNCEAELCEDRIWIVARRDIAAGEEITFNYGYDLVDYQEYPCRCGSPDCVGYIVAEEFFAHVRQRRAAGAEAASDGRAVARAFPLPHEIPTDRSAGILPAYRFRTG